ncbi:archease [Chroococcidiopsis sp.]|uniref:archease n=1 Tax=Chroococcidiopsis sp. TaxID=3088168 RepID=UPI003F2A2971
MEHADLLKPEGFEEIEHTADWAYRVWGQSLAELFVRAAQGLYYLVGMQLAAEPQVVREIHLQGVDNESLLVAWLNELIYIHESENLGFEQIEILQLDGKTLYAKVTGSPTQQWLKDIKAATYHNLAIHSTETGFEATLVLDV